MLVAASVSVGNAIADTPEVATPAMPAAPEIVAATPELPAPIVAAPAAPEAPVVAPPVEPAAAAPVDVPAPEPAPASDVPVAADTGAVEANAAASEATTSVAAAEVASSEPDAAEVTPRNHVPNHPDPCEGAPTGSYPSGGSCRINICHATGSQTNPYVFISPNVNSVTHEHGHEGHGGDIIGVSSAADCPSGTSDPCEGEDQEGAYSNGNNCVVDICHATGSTTNPYVAITVSTNGLEGHGGHAGDLIPAPEGGCPTDGTEGCPAPAYEDTNGRCVVDICHATGSSTNPYVAITVSANGLEGHGGHAGDIIPAPANGCPPGEGNDCPPPAYENTNGQCVVDICHATGSSTNPYVLITVSVNGLNGHGDHPGDIIPAPANGCPGVTDACPGPLNPGVQPPGTVCVTDACPGDLNPGDQPFGFPCVVDVCPDALNPGNQPFGTTCIVDACPDALNPGVQLPGTTCITFVPPPVTPDAVPTPTPTPTPVPPAAGPEPSVPVEEPVVDEVIPVVDTPVLGVQDEPEAAPVAGAQDAPEGELPFTGARTFLLTVLAMIAFLAGAGLVRRRPRSTNPE